MKLTIRLILSSGLLLLSSCAMFESRQSAQPADVTNKALAVPVGKDWKIIEEAPKLSNDRLPFQTEQSLQPEGVRPVTPVEKLDIETVR